MGSSSSLVDEFRACMKEKFEMSDLGLLHNFLGLEVKQAEDGIFISQRKYATDLLKWFNMLNCKAPGTPMSSNEKLQLEDGTEAADAKYFRSLVDGLIYLARTRPDISFTVGVISSDWAGCLDDRKSTLGYAFSLGSGVISWSSKKQATTILSSSEAEFATATSAACQAIWLQKYLQSLIKSRREHGNLL